ncbi:type II secretion system F family protein, partial [Paracraurococcus ruber]
LALLLGAGLPLDAALDALAGAEARRPARRLLQALREGLRGGAGLGQAVAARPGAVPGWYAAAIQAAEGTGRLPEVLERLAAELLRQARLAERLRSGLTYPVLVLGLALVTIGVLAGLVLPALEPLFAAGGEVPASTRTVLAAGAWIRAWGLPVLVLLLAAALLALRAGAAPGARQRRDAA